MRARQHTLVESRWSARTAAACALLLGSPALSQTQTVLLWPGGAPGSEKATGAEVVRLSERGDHVVSNVHAPSVTVYLPEHAQASGAAMIVIPGGAHTELCMDHEGYRVAEVLAAHGVAAFVLKYRLARAKGSPYTVERHALADVQRAIRLVRSRAAEWSVDATRVGVIGFSAGGELAVLAGAHPDPGIPTAVDPLERLS